MLIDQKAIRNKEVNDKEEAAKKQNRKANAVISVQVLHKLQKQAHPSCVFLFYQDLEE